MVGPSSRGCWGCMAMGDVHMLICTCMFVEVNRGKTPELWQDARSLCRACCCGVQTAWLVLVLSR